MSDEEFPKVRRYLTKADLMAEVAYLRKMRERVELVVTDMREAIDRQRECMKQSGGQSCGPIEHPLSTATPSVLRNIEHWARALDGAVWQFDVKDKP